MNPHQYKVEFSESIYAGPSILLFIAVGKQHMKSYLISLIVPMGKTNSLFDYTLK